MIKFSYGFARSQNGILLFNPTEFGKVLFLLILGMFAQWPRTYGQKKTNLKFQ